MLDCQLLKTFDELLLVSGFLSVFPFILKMGTNPVSFSLVILCRPMIVQVIKELDTTYVALAKRSREVKPM